MNIKLSSKDNSTIKLHFNDNITRIGLNAVGSINSYEGDYVVVPLNEPQTIECGGKKMKEDLLVGSVPYSSIDNSDGGKTITIG